MKRYAVFDRGSNSIKFLVAEARGGQGRFCVLRERSIPTRLTEHLIDTAVLRPEAMERMPTALRELRAEAREAGVQRFRAVATSAVRDSRNRREFLKAARAVLGFPVRLLSGAEEAETIFAGVTPMRTGGVATCSSWTSAARSGGRAGTASWSGV